jgi:hypothetical protein
MGAGNYLPGASEVYPQTAEVEGGTYYEMVYVNSTYSTGDGNVDAILNKQSKFEVDLRCQIDQILSGKLWREWEGWTWQSNIVKVELKEEYYVYYPLFVTPIHPLGIPHTERISRRLFDGLAAAGYKLSVRTGSWTSAPYTVSIAGK